jgi:hypothetical protein
MKDKELRSLLTLDDRKNVQVYAGVTVRAFFFLLVCPRLAGLSGMSILSSTIGLAGVGDSAGSSHAMLPK